MDRLNELIDSHPLPSWRPVAWFIMMILAGGLHPGNVAEAIERVRPWGVDVASGVESAPGTKDLKLVEQFIREARRAFEAVDG